MSGVAPVPSLAPLVVLLVAAAAALLVPARPRLDVALERRAPDGQVPGWLQRHRALWSALAAIGAWVVVGGAAGWVAALAVGPVVWVVISRAEPAHVRRRREEVLADLPHVVSLLAAALRAGAAPAEAVEVVCRALPGAATERLGSSAARLRLGGAPAEVWAALAGDRELAPLGRTLARAEQTGAPVATAVERLADDLAARSRGLVEDRARAVGVKAAVPLGLCLLPAFVLIGIVPLVAGLMTTIDW